MKLGIATLILSLITLGAAAGCSAGTNDEVVDGTDDMLTTVSASELAGVQATSLGNLTFDLLTPAGEQIMKASHYWMGRQASEPRYPRPHMCASNVSKVFFLSGITEYDQEGVRNLIADVKGKGAEVFKMPQDKRGFLRTLATMHGGHIPAGTLLAGENVHTANPGDQHVGFIGHEDADGTLWAYHNNWYRPENEGGQRKPFMVSPENLAKGYLRQWMAVPWVRFTKDASGAIVDVDYLIPGIDDLNPFNPDYQVTLAIPAEIAEELK
jgi:hypothetical protein